MSERVKQALDAFNKGELKDAIPLILTELIEIRERLEGIEHHIEYQKEAAEALLGAMNTNKKERVGGFA